MFRITPNGYFKGKNYKKIKDFLNNEGVPYVENRRSFIVEKNINPDGAKVEEISDLLLVKENNRYVRSIPPSFYFPKKPVMEKVGVNMSGEKALYIADANRLPFSYLQTNAHEL